MVLNMEFVFSTTRSASSFLTPFLRRNHSKKHRLRVTVAQKFAFSNVREFDMVRAMCSACSAHAYISCEPRPKFIGPTSLPRQALANNYIIPYGYKSYIWCAHSHSDVSVQRVLDQVFCTSSYITFHS